MTISTIEKLENYYQSMRDREREYLDILSYIHQSDGVPVTIKKMIVRRLSSMVDTIEKSED
jgi:hypothetical protein